MELNTVTVFHQAMSSTLLPQAANKEEAANKESGFCLSCAFHQSMLCTLLPQARAQSEQTQRAASPTKNLGIRP